MPLEGIIQPNFILVNILTIILIHIHVYRHFHYSHPQYIQFMHTGVWALDTGCQEKDSLSTVVSKPIVRSHFSTRAMVTFWGRTDKICTIASHGPSFMPTMSKILKMLNHAINLMPQHSCKRKEKAKQSCHKSAQCIKIDPYHAQQ